MHLNHSQSVLPATDGISKVTAVAWSRNSVKFAVVTVDRVVMVFDETGKRRDKFSTKPNDDGPKNYKVTGIVWSPDSTRLAVAQSDKIVFVYKLAKEPHLASSWEKSKSICNKFKQGSPVTCIDWPAESPGQLVYGLAVGQVRFGDVKKNKSTTFYSTHSPVIALKTSPDGLKIVSSHMNGKLFTFHVGVDDSPRALVTHSVPAFCLGWGESIIASGADKKIVFYSEDGRVEQVVDYSQEKDESEFTSCAISPSGQSVVLASYNRLRAFDYNSRRQKWDASAAKDIENLYTTTAMAWKPDGSKMAVGNLCGAVDVFDCCLKKTLYKGKFEFTYVGPSQVIVTKLSSGSRIVLRSRSNYEIEKINVLGNDRYLVAYTNETLLIGDLASCRLSEVEWQNATGKEKFYFENPRCCLIFSAGELSVVEYGVDEILGSIRTEHMSPHVLSLCVGGRASFNTEDNKLIAFLVDARTLCVVDLLSGSTVCNIDHDSKIDWLELNETGRKLLYRDRRHRLFLFDINSEETSTLSSYCSYVQWVPNSDVIVAQNRNNLCVWYSVDHPDRVTSFEIKGDVEDIERVDGRTDVLVDEGVNQVAYTLDEGLIEFGTAVEDGDYVRAVMFLENIDDTPESRAMWSTLAELSLKADELAVAERCYSAIGNISKASYLHTINEAKRKEGEDSSDARARVAALNKHFKLAETIYLESGDTEKAISMYQGMHQWSHAIAVAESRNLPQLNEMKSNYLSWLLESGQDEKAGELKEEEGDLHGALTYYMKAGMPGRAASVVMRNSELSLSQDVVERVAAALTQASLYETAGELYEKAGLTSRALEAYKRGKSYGHAIELARTAFPQDVVTLEEQWGDYLVSQKQMDAAIKRFIEAGQITKAIDAAIKGRQWTKACQIVDSQDETIARAYYKPLAEHFASVRDYNNASKYFIKSRNVRAAVDMFVAAGKWDEAHGLSSKYLPKEDVADLYLKKAQELEEQHKYKDAEKLYVSVDEPDYAINMYKRINQHDDMIRLIEKYHPDLLADTFDHLANELRDGEKYAQAETYYVRGGKWKDAVNMYRTADMWEDAHRVAKIRGGDEAGKQVGYLWAKSLGGDSAVKLLEKLNMVSEGIDFACDQGAFDFAFELARLKAKNRLSDVHFKYAMYFEEEGQLARAEEEFIKAGKPREAVLMYVHAQDWDSAQRVAEGHDEDSISDVLVGQARVAFSSKDFGSAETFLLRAERPELAVRYYKEAAMFDDALRLAREYVPSALPALEEHIRRLGIDPSTPKGGENAFEEAKRLERMGEHKRAIQTYLSINSETCESFDEIQDANEKAAELARKFVSNSAAEVVTNACRNLVGIDRYGAAADLFLSVDMVNEAVQTSMAGGLWDKAKEIAGDSEDDAMIAFVAERYETHLQDSGDTESLAKVNVIAALDLLAEKGNWQECMAEAESHGGAVLNKYAALFAANLLSAGDAIHAVQVFKRFGAPSTPNNFNLYRKLCFDLLSDELSSTSYEHVAALRDILATVCGGLSVSQHGQHIVDEFDRLTLICHYFAFKIVCKSSQELRDLYVKLCISLLRYTDIVPGDRSFYEAGNACREAELDNMAYLFLNRFVDLSNAIEEGDLSSVDNSDFAETDIPFEIPLPDEPSIEESERKDVNNWVISVAIEQDLDQVLDMDERGVFVGSLVNKNTGEEAKPCVVSGYPVLDSAIDMDKGKAANRTDWNKFVMAVNTAHDDKLSDVLTFLNGWCSAPTNPSYTF
eukprot:m.12051 g.12051  ORF g.12051 m.12051 type:complete len:1743 (+) comp7113_c0_seq1:45-5273(+)